MYKLTIKANVDGVRDKDEVYENVFEFESRSLDQSLYLEFGEYEQALVKLNVGDVLEVTVVPDR